MCTVYGETLTTLYIHKITAHVGYIDLQGDATSLANSSTLAVIFPEITLIL